MIRITINPFPLTAFTSEMTLVLFLFPVDFMACSRWIHYLLGTVNGFMDRCAAFTTPPSYKQPFIFCLFVWQKISVSVT